MDRSSSRFDDLWIFWRFFWNHTCIQSLQVCIWGWFDQKILISLGASVFAKFAPYILKFFSYFSSQENVREQLEEGGDRRGDGCPTLECGLAERWRLGDVQLLDIAWKKEESPENIQLLDISCKKKRREEASNHEIVHHPLF